MANPEDLDYFTKEAIQYSMDYFDYFMKGQSYEGYNKRLPILRKFQVPRWDPPREDPALKPPGDGPVNSLSIPRFRVPFRQHSRNDSGANRSVNEELEESLENLGLKLIRVVGAGSQGLAVLFQCGDHKIVLKWGTDVEAMVIEMWAMRKLAGARHIVQVCLGSIHQSNGSVLEGLSQSVPFWRRGTT